MLRHVGGAPLAAHQRALARLGPSAADGHPLGPRGSNWRNATIRQPPADLRPLWPPTSAAARPQDRPCPHTGWSPRVWGTTHAQGWLLQALLQLRWGVWCRWEVGVCNGLAHKGARPLPNMVTFGHHVGCGRIPWSSRAGCVVQCVAGQAWPRVEVRCWPVFAACRCPARVCCHLRPKPSFPLHVHFYHFTFVNVHFRAL